MRAPSRPPPNTQTETCAHTNTGRFVWLGKGSYWRILSGKRTFSNKWWWNLRWKIIVSSSFFVFSIYDQHCASPPPRSVFDPGQVSDWLKRFLTFGLWVHLRPHRFLNPKRKRFCHVSRSRCLFAPYGSPFLPERCLGLTQKHPSVGEKSKRNLRRSENVGIPLHARTNYPTWWNDSADTGDDKIIQHAE